MLPLISVRRETNRIDIYFNREVSRHLWIYTKKITLAIVPKLKWFELALDGKNLYSLQIGTIKIHYANWGK